MQPITAAEFAAAPPATYLISTDTESGAPHADRVDLAMLSWELSLHRWRPVLVDRHHVATKQAMLAVLAAALDVPDWFGDNWDALVDVLRDRADEQPLALLFAECTSEAFVPAEHPSDELGGIATVVDIVDDLVVEGVALKLGLVAAG